MECQECGHTPLPFLLHQQATLNVYDIRCLCRRHYCGLCGLSSHFPALCQERTLWQEYFMNRDEHFLGIYEHMQANTIARRNMEGWRNQVGPAEFDIHPHMRFAVEELSRVSNLNTWVRVVARFSVVHVQLLLSPQFLQMIHRYNILFNQFMDSMNAQPPMFELGVARLALCQSAVDLLSLLRSNRNPQAIVYPVHFNQEMINYNINFDRALAMWRLYSLR